MEICFAGSGVSCGIPVIGHVYGLDSSDSDSDNSNNSISRGGIRAECQTSHIRVASRTHKEDRREEKQKRRRAERKSSSSKCGAVESSPTAERNTLATAAVAAGHSSDYYTNNTNSSSSNSTISTSTSSSSSSEEDEGDITGNFSCGCCCADAVRNPQGPNCRNNISLLVSLSPPQHGHHQHHNDCTPEVDETCVENKLSEADNNDSNNNNEADDDGDEENQHKHCDFSHLHQHTCRRQEQQEQQQQKQECQCSDGSIHTNRFNVLIDCGKTFRSSFLRVLAPLQLTHVDALFITHGHADAMHCVSEIADLHTNTYRCERQWGGPLSSSPTFPSSSSSSSSFGRCCCCSNSVWRKAYARRLLHIPTYLIPKALEEIAFVSPDLVARSSTRRLDNGGEHTNNKSNNNNNNKQSEGCNSGGSLAKIKEEAVVDSKADCDYGEDTFPEGGAEASLDVCLLPDREVVYLDVNGLDHFYHNTDNNHRHNHQHQHHAEKCYHSSSSSFGSPVPPLSPQRVTFYTLPVEHGKNYMSLGFVFGRLHRYARMHRTLGGAPSNIHPTTTTISEKNRSGSESGAVAGGEGEGGCETEENRSTNGGAAEMEGAKHVQSSPNPSSNVSAPLVRESCVVYLSDISLIPESSLASPLFQHLLRVPLVAAADGVYRNDEGEERENEERRVVKTDTRDCEHQQQSQEQTLCNAVTPPANHEQQENKPQSLPHMTGPITTTTTTTTPLNRHHVTHQKHNTTTTTTTTTAPSSSPTTYTIIDILVFDVVAERGGAPSPSHTCWDDWIPYVRVLAPRASLAVGMFCSVEHSRGNAQARRDLRREKRVVRRMLRRIASLEEREGGYGACCCCGDGGDDCGNSHALGAAGRCEDGDHSNNNIINDNDGSNSRQALLGRRPATSVKSSNCAENNNLPSLEKNYVHLWVLETDREERRRRRRRREWQRNERRKKRSLQQRATAAPYASNSESSSDSDDDTDDNTSKITTDEASPNSQPLPASHLCFGVDVSGWSVTARRHLQYYTERPVFSTVANTPAKLRQFIECVQSMELAYDGMRVRVL